MTDLEARAEQLVEAMARAMATSGKPEFRRRSDRERNHSATCALSCCWEEVIPDPETSLARMAAAALNVVRTEREMVPCSQPLCVNGTLMHPDATTEPLPMGPCPGCIDGSVPGELLVVGLIGEQVDEHTHRWNVPLYRMEQG